MQVAESHAEFLMGKRMGGMTTEPIQRFIMREDAGMPEVKSLTDLFRSDKVKKTNRAEHGVNVLHSHIYMVSSRLKIFK